MTKRLVLTGIVEFDLAKAVSLETACDEAVKQGKEIFTWEGHEMYVPYVHYLLAYLKERINGAQE